MFLQVQEAARLVAPWADLYSNHPIVQSAVVFAHLSGLMVGGGAAFAADRAALRARRADAAGRLKHLEQLRGVHSTVLVSLTVVVISGVLLFTADLETFVASPVFWVKMALVLALAINGFVIMRTGRSLQQPDAPADKGWKRLATTSVMSLGLWLVIVLAGAILVNIG
jgi:uncharacterized membrane protein